MKNVLKKLTRALAVATILTGLLGASAQATETLTIIPKPMKMEMKEGSFEITPATTIGVRTDAEEAIANQLVDRMATAMGVRLKVLSFSEIATFKNVITLNLTDGSKAFGKEGYRLMVEKDGVAVFAQKPAGLFYGTQTLLQILPTDILRSVRVKNVKWTMPLVTIEDKPRFAWRGAMLDPARNFLSVDFIKKYIDTLAFHKMNTLHLHLTDDQGWRIEIKKHPKLTEIGSERKETVVGHAARSKKFDGKPHAGFYTQDELRDLVAYAETRHINILPEIEMPGHAQAAVAAYPELGNLDKPLEVSTTWGVHRNVYNAEESTILFLQDVLTEVLDIFPSEFIHIGGDEAPKNQWKASAKAQARMKELHLEDEEELQSYFIRRMDKFLTDRGRRLIGWDEILEGGLAENATVMSWRGIKGGITAAKAGHDVVMAPTTFTYLDYYQTRKKDLEPLAIGGYLPLSKVYSYNPVPDSFTPAEAKRVLGTQCQIWGEYIATPWHVEYMSFPRLTALSEVAWSPNESKDYDDFMRRLPTQLKRLDALLVRYFPIEPEPVVVGRWKSGEPTEKFAVREWDITKFLKEAGDYKVLFNYTGGAHRLDIEWLELTENGKTLSSDRHKGTTGASNRANTYALKIESLKPSARYALKTSIRSDMGTDSNGEVHLIRSRK